MLIQAIDWDSFCGRMDFIHPKFDVSARIYDGLIEETTPRLKRVSKGYPAIDLYSWYMRHKEITVRATPMTLYGTMRLWERIAEGWLHITSRKTWKSGVWDHEPDFLLWNDLHTPCVLSRNHFGAWCGYVGLPEGHPSHGKGWDDLFRIRVHGGITFAGPSPPGVRAAYTQVRETAPKRAWWVGFDSGHFCDTVPTFAKCLLGS